MNLMDPMGATSCKAARLGQTGFLRKISMMRGKMACLFPGSDGRGIPFLSVLANGTKASLEGTPPTVALEVHYFTTVSAQCQTLRG